MNDELHAERMAMASWRDQDCGDGNDSDWLLLLRAIGEITALWSGVPSDGRPR